MPNPYRYILSVCLLAVALASCSFEEAQNDQHELVLAIDRTYPAQSDTWSTEIAARLPAVLESAVSNGADQVTLIGLGSNMNQTATIATADLSAIEGNTSAKRDEARQRLIDDITSAAAQVAAEPVETHGTDVFAAFQQAASLCQAPEVTECSVHLLGDLEDQRVLALASPDDAVKELGHLMPDLSGVSSVSVSGLGASGADAETVQKVKAAWELLLAEAGAVDVIIARSVG